MILLQITDDVLRAVCGTRLNCSTVIEKERSKEVALADDIRGALPGQCAVKTPCALLLSRRHAVFKRLVLPSQDERELSAMAKLRLAEYLPLGMDQGVLDFRILTTRTDGYSEILLAVSPETIIQPYVTAVQEAGMIVSDIYLTSDGIDSVVRQAGTDLFGKEACFGLVLFDSRWAEASFYSGRQWMFSYYCPFGQRDILENGRAAAQEIARCADDVERSFAGKTVSAVWLVLDSGKADVFQECLLRERPWSVRCWDARRYLPDAVQTFFDDQKMNVSWIPLLGCLMKDRQTRFMNMLPKRLSVLKDRKKKRNDVFKIGTACVLAGVCIVVFFASLLANEARGVETLRQEVSLLDPEIEQCRIESEFLEMVSRQMRPSFSAAAVISALSEVIPDEVMIQSLGMRVGGRWEIDGIARSDQGVGRVESALVSSPLFGQVEFQQAVKRVRFGREDTEFKMTFFSGDENEH